MATREELSIALDDMLYLTGVHRSMRCNAIEYQVRLAEGQDPVEVARVANGNTTAYKALLDQRQSVRSDRRQAQALANGLTASGIDPAEHDDLLASMTELVDSHLESPVEADAEALSAFAVDTLAAAPVLGVMVRPGVIAR